MGNLNEYYAIIPIREFGDMVDVFKDLDEEDIKSFEKSNWIIPIKDAPAFLKEKNLKRTFFVSYLPVVEEFLRKEGITDIV